MTNNDSGICILFKGFAGVSTDDSADSSKSASETGMDLLAAKIGSAGMGLEVHVRDHEVQADTVKAVVRYLKQHPKGPVIVIGHSFGGDSAVEATETMGDKGINVDLLIQIDSVGVGDETKPSNAKRGINIYSTSGEGVDGARHVAGSANCGLASTSHTEIDTDKRTWDIILFELRNLLGLTTGGDPWAACDEKSG